MRECNTCSLSRISFGCVSRRILRKIARSFALLAPHKATASRIMRSLEHRSTSRWADGGGFSCSDRARPNRRSGATAQPNMRDLAIGQRAARSLARLGSREIKEQLALALAAGERVGRVGGAGHKLAWPLALGGLFLLFLFGQIRGKFVPLANFSMSFYGRAGRGARK